MIGLLIICLILILKIDCVETKHRYLVLTKTTLGDVLEINWS